MNDRRCWQRNFGRRVGAVIINRVGNAGLIIGDCASKSLTRDIRNRTGNGPAPDKGADGAIIDRAGQSKNDVRAIFKCGSDGGIGGHRAHTAGYGNIISNGNRSASRHDKILAEIRGLIEGNRIRATASPSTSRFDGDGRDRPLLTIRSGVSIRNRSCARFCAGSRTSVVAICGPKLGLTSPGANDLGDKANIPIGRGEHQFAAGRTDRYARGGASGSRIRRGCA